jgi:hypothetical protein
MVKKTYAKITDKKFRNALIMIIRFVNVEPVNGPY